MHLIGAAFGRPRSFSRSLGEREARRATRLLRTVTELVETDLAADGKLSWRPSFLGADDPLPSALMVFRAEMKDRFVLEVSAWPCVDKDGKLEIANEPLAVIPVSEEELRKGAVAQPFSIFGNEVPVPIPFLDGHAYAVTKSTAEEIARRVADSGNNAPDLAWLLPRPTDVEEDLSRARESAFEPYAWAVWSGWRGDPELVAQVARAGQWALEDVGIGGSRTSITVHVDGDWERFSEPRELVADLTRQAARRFDAVHIRQSPTDGTSGPVIDVTITRGRFPNPEREWIRDAVLLEVATPDVGRYAEVVAVRDRVRQAIERGRKLLDGRGVPGAGVAERDRSGGLTEPGGGPKARIEAQGSFLGLVGGFGVVLLVLAYWTFPEDSTLVELWAIAFGVLSGVVAALLAISWLLTGIELGSSTRLLRASSIVKAVVIAVAGAAAPVLVKWSLATFFGIEAG